MKYILTFTFLLISYLASSQVELAPENEILKNTKIIKIDRTSTFIPTPVMEINVPAPQEYKETDLSRLIFFVHGLGGTDESWEKAADACQNPFYNQTNFHARKVVSLRMDYNNTSQGHLSDAALTLREYIQVNANNFAQLDYVDDDVTRNFIIAHSQGGVVSRSLLHADFISDPMTPADRGYGGLVTVSSPLQGAMILNNSEFILNMANDACQSLVLGPASSIQAQTILNLIGKDVTSITCSTFAYNLMPELFKDNLAPITEDYHVNAPWINVLNNDPNNSNYVGLPKVAFYGVEPRSNLFWRTVNWFITTPNTVDPWQANDDFALLNGKIIPMYNYYYKNYMDEKNRMANVVANPWTYFPHAELSYFYALFRMLMWNEGVLWFNRANRQWEVVIGAYSKTTTTSAPYYKCLSYLECDGMGPYNVYHISNASDCPCNQQGPPYFHLSGPFTDIIVNEFYKESDGVVLAESSSNLPGYTHIPVKLNGIEYPDGSFTGSSHMQIRNDDALRKNLDKLFNGEYGPYFQTDVKP